MYWEDVYDMYEFASNLDVQEKNEDMHFQFLLHAQSKEAINKWKDMPIPFPDRSWKPPEKSTLENSIKSKENSPMRRFIHSTKATPEQLERKEYISKRMKEHQEKLKAIQFQGY